MYRDFLKKNRLIKLNIWKEFGQTSNLSIDILQVTKKLNLSEVSMMRQINALNDDIIDISGLSVIKQNRHSFKLELGSFKEYSDLYKKLTIYYVSFSSAYSLCELICNGELITINGAGEKLSLSTPHVYRIIKELNNSVKKYQVEFRKDRNNIIRIIGDELNVRLFIYLFVSQESQLETSYNRLINKAVLNDVFLDSINLSRFKEYSNLKLVIILNVFKLRMVQKEWLPRSNNKELFEMHLFDIKGFDAFFTSTLVYDKATQLNEFSYLNFFIYLFIPEFFDDEFMRRYENQINALDQPEAELCKKVVSEWQKNLGISLGKELLTKYRLYCYTIFKASYEFNVDILSFSHFTRYFMNDKIKTNVVRLSLSEKVNNILQKERLTEALSEKDVLFSQNFTYLFYVESQKYRENIVLIKLDFFDQLVIQDYLKQKLTYIYGDSMMLIDDEQEASIVITDRYNYETDKPLIVIDEVFNRDNFNLILNAINHIVVSDSCS